MKIEKRWAWQLVSMAIAFVFALGMIMGFLVSFLDEVEKTQNIRRSLDETVRGR
jgi:hypothetical protein